MAVAVDEVEEEGREGERLSGAETGWCFCAQSALQPSFARGNQRDKQLIDIKRLRYLQLVR